MKKTLTEVMENYLEDSRNDSPKISFDFLPLKPIKSNDWEKIEKFDDIFFQKDFKFKNKSKLLTFVEKIIFIEDNNLLLTIKNLDVKIKLKFNNISTKNTIQKIEEYFLNKQD